jgi:hypothetical protein
MVESLVVQHVQLALEVVDHAAGPAVTSSPPGPPPSLAGMPPL